MVEVGDKVFVTPVNGQKDYIAVITGPGGAGAVLNEGNYNTWTKEWINKPSNGINDYGEIDVLIDERNGKLSVGWEDISYDYRFGIYNISDFGAVFESPLGTDYMPYWPTMSSKTFIGTGLRYLTYGGMSQSIQTYLLFTRSDEYTIEVWRGGASVLWSRSTQTDFGGNCRCFTGGISLTGKYILAVIKRWSSPYDISLMLYKGSYVE